MLPCGTEEPKSLILSHIMTIRSVIWNHQLMHHDVIDDVFELKAAQACETDQPNMAMSTLAKV